MHVDIAVSSKPNIWEILPRVAANRTLDLSCSAYWIWTVFHTRIGNDAESRIFTNKMFVNDRHPSSKRTVS